MLSQIEEATTTSSSNISIRSPQDKMPTRNKNNKRDHTYVKNKADFMKNKNINIKEKNHAQSNNQLSCTVDEILNKEDEGNTKYSPCDLNKQTDDDNGIKYPENQTQRIVILYKNSNEEGLGISITGGREHGVPILISEIHKGLLADR